MLKLSERTFMQTSKWTAQCLSSVVYQRVSTLFGSSVQWNACAVALFSSLERLEQTKCEKPSWDKAFGFLPPELFLMLLVVYAKVEVQPITASACGLKRWKDKVTRKAESVMACINFVPHTKYGFYSVQEYIASKSCYIFQLAFFFFRDARVDRRRQFFSYIQFKLGC